MRPPWEPWVCVPPSCGYGSHHIRVGEFDTCRNLSGCELQMSTGCLCLSGAALERDGMKEAEGMMAPLQSPAMALQLHLHLFSDPEPALWRGEGPAHHGKYNCWGPSTVPPK